MKKFPKEIYVTHEEDGPGSEWLCAHETAGAALDSTERTQVAIYELKEVKEGKLEPVFSSIVG